MQKESPASGLCRPRRPIAILSYHQTAPDDAPGTRLSTLVLPPHRFARQMEALHALGWRGLSLRDLQPYLRGENSGKVFGITLDDGYRGNFEHALPVLRRLGFTATAFAVSAHVGGRNEWDLRHGAAEHALMDRSQLRDWAAAGMEVGAHTRHHVNLCACDAPTAWAEIAGSRDELQDIVGEPVRSFSYPYGQHTMRHARLVRDAGFAFAATIATGRATPQADPWRLPRVSVHSTDSLHALVARVTTPLEEWRVHWRSFRRRWAIDMAVPLRG